MPLVDLFNPTHRIGIHIVSAPLSRKSRSRFEIDNFVVDARTRILPSRNPRPLVHYG